MKERDLKDQGGPVPYFFGYKMDFFHSKTIPNLHPFYKTNVDD